MLEIRAHNLLCIQGFIGLGYSEKFVANMTKIVDELRSNPETKVKISVSPDNICSACPHLSDQGCTLKGEGHELHMRRQDLDVLKRLGCKEGEALQWSEIIRRIAKNITGSELTKICGQCPWLPSGLCARGIDRL